MVWRSALKLVGAKRAGRVVISRRSEGGIDLRWKVGGDRVQKGEGRVVSNVCERECMLLCKCVCGIGRLEGACMRHN